MDIRGCAVTTMTAADATIGKCLFVSASIRGSAGAMEITLLDGAAAKLYYQAAITADGGSPVFTHPIGFNNLIVDATGTGAYSIVYIPVP